MDPNEQRMAASPINALQIDWKKGRMVSASEDLHASGAAGAYDVADTPDLDGSAASARQRSSSPWAFTLSTKAVNRVRSNDGSGVSTPIGRYGRVLSAGAAAASRQAAARASYESALLTAVRKQMDALEEKVTSQISRAQSDTNRLREASLKSLEDKVSIAEGLQPRLDRRIAEISGHFKGTLQGLSEEMQSQIRRVDLMDERLWDWRHQMEEEFQKKYSEFDSHVQKVSSSSRVIHSSLEDAHKKHGQRLQRLESELNERTAAQEDTREGLLHLHSRLEEVEQRHGLSEDFAQTELRSRGVQEHNHLNDDIDHHSEILAMHEKRMADLCEKVEHLFQDSIDLHTAGKAHEVELKTLRTLFETREEHHRMLTERVERSDWDGKLEQVRQAIQEEHRSKMEHHECMQLVAKRLEHHEAAYDELLARHDNLLRGHMDLSQLQGDVHLGDVGLDAPPTSDVLHHEVGAGSHSSIVEDCVARLASVEHRLEAIDSDVSVLSHVGALVSQLKELGPKVIDHEHRIVGLEGLRTDLKDHVREVPALRTEVKELSPRIKQSVTREELERCVSKEQLASTTTLLRSSLQDLCCDIARREVDEALSKMKASNKTGEVDHGDVGQLRRDHHALHGKMISMEKNMAGAVDATETRHKRDLDDLRCQISLLQERTRERPRCRSGDDTDQTSARLTEEVATAMNEVRSVGSEIASLRAAFNSILTSGDAGSSQLEELVLAVQQDEQLEQEKHQRLLQRIDELCERLAAVDQEMGRLPANASSKVHALAGEGGTAANGIPAELSTKLEALADRVERESHKYVDLHTKLEAVMLGQR